MSRVRWELHRGWTVRLEEGGPPPSAELRGLELPAQVPGCVHDDLLTAGVIDDPYLDRNELQVQWVGESAWRYACTFELPAGELPAGDLPAGLLEHEHVELVCDGLDTVATVTLNGVEVARTQNMHRRYRFPVKELLRPGANELVIAFASALRFAEAQRDAHGDLPRAYELPYNFVRKMACSFGWDWGPTLITAGIWRPIALEGWSEARLASVRPRLTRLPESGTESAELEVQVGLVRADEGEPPEVVAVLSGPDGAEVARAAGAATGAATGEAMLTLTVPAPQLWWPRGHGAQPLYALEVTARRPDGALLDRREVRVGLRTVTLDTTTDTTLDTTPDTTLDTTTDTVQDGPAGSAFTIRVNGKPIFCRGSNWIPDDALPSRVTAARYRRRLEQAADANMNMVRVWGGGIYEADAFYDVCDELGLMVWQDFAFSCAAYPEELLAAEVAAEARDQLLRLAPHPSLVLWNGNNENLWGYRDWGWREQIGERSWGRGFYLELLPALVAELDPGRPYWPGSPASDRSDSAALHPNDPRHGCIHIWDVWNERDYTAYREYRPRFVSEFGFQAPPTFATLRRAVHDDPLTPDSPGMLHHQKAEDGQGKLERGLLAHFPATVLRDFDRWHYATELNQARAITLGVTHFRVLMPHCMGALYWQLNDCWPVTSWAAIDGDGRPKPLWFASRRFFADRLLTFVPDGDELLLAVVNDRDEPWSAEVTLSRRDFLGEVLAAETYAIMVAPRAVRKLPLSPALARAGRPERELIAARAGAGLGAEWFFARDKELAYPEPRFEAVLEGAAPRWTLRLRAETLLRDVLLQVDRLEPAARVSDGLLTLLPGEEALFTIEAQAPLTAAALTRPPVWWCANLNLLR